MKLWLLPIAFGLLWLVSGCSQIGGTTSPGTPSKVDPPQQEYYDATITFYQDDHLSGVLHAGRIRKYERQAMVFLDSNLVMDFYNDQGQHTTKLWADSGRTDENRRDMIAMGHVVAKSDSGQVLETQQLRWDNRAKQIISDVRVKLSTPTDTIYGIGFVSDDHLKNWRVDQPIGKTFRELEKRPPRDAAFPPPVPEAQKAVKDSV
jgi:LPS export ABC transporter protein LptC